MLSRVVSSCLKTSVRSTLTVRLCQPNTFTEYYSIIPIPKQYKKVLYDKPINFKKLPANDTLNPVTVSPQNIGSLHIYFLTNQFTQISSDKIAMLLYQFAKHNLLTQNVYDRLQPFIRKYKGEYSLRSVYGVLMAVFKVYDPHFFDFFRSELANHPHQLVDDEVFDLGEALAECDVFTLEQKQEFFNNYLMPGMPQYFQQGYQTRFVQHVFRYMRILNKLEIYDETIWNPMFSQLKGKSGPKILDIYNQVSLYADKFPEAQTVLDEYEPAILEDVDMVWRYNIAQKRYYTNQEMIAKSQENIQLIPAIRSMFPAEAADFLNEQHQILKERGTLQAEAQIEEDKAKALSYALYEKYSREGSEKDMFDPREFEDMFGMNEEQIRKFIQDTEAMEDEIEAANEGEEEESGTSQEEASSSQEEAQAEQKKKKK